MGLNLIMPMAGGGTRFLNGGFETPKPLIEIYGKPFFYWAARSIQKFVELRSLTFVVLKEHAERFSIEKKILQFFPQAKIKKIPQILPGAVLTCKAGIEDISENESVLFNDCDHLFLCPDFVRFCGKKKFKKIDGGLLTFFSNDARFSYALCDKNGFVQKTAEKKPISNCAICGAYYFSTKKIFCRALETYLKTCRYKEFFTSGIYNVLAEWKMKTKIFATKKHVSFGTPEEYKAALLDKTFLQLE